MVSRPSLTLVVFVAAALAEIGSGYLIWIWRKQGKSIALAGIGAVVLFIYGIIQTLQPTEFGRAYAAYGGIFIISAISGGRMADKKHLDKYEIIGSLIAIIGAMVIFYSLR